MNSFDATSTKDKLQERTTKSFLYSDFADHWNRKIRDWHSKDKEDKKSYEDKESCKENKESNLTDKHEEREATDLLTCSNELNIFEAS
jgi:hypothetical protein